MTTLVDTSVIGRTVRAEPRAVATRKKPAAAPYQDLVSAHATERLPDHATDSVSHTRNTPRASMTGRTAPPASNETPRARDTPNQATTSRTVPTTGARPVRWEYSIQATGTQAAIASGRSRRTSVNNTQPPTSATPRPTLRARRAPVSSATRNAPPAISAGSAAGRAGRAVRASASDIPMVG